MTAVEIKDITLPENMQRAMAKQAEAEREKRSKIIAAEGELTSHLAISAAQDALRNSPIQAEDIEAIIVATVTPDSSFPSMACLVQKAIGAKHAAAFDLGAQAT